MFNPTQLVIDAFVEHLRDNYHRMYGSLEPEYPNIIGFCGRLALENLANSDALYHDVNHTILVTEVGQEILRGKHLSEGGVSPQDWLHFAISLLCHDIGYVRGVCSGDRPRAYVIDDDGGTVSPPEGTTDAFMTPYHVFRSQQFIRERFGKVSNIDIGVVCANIANTRFPVPEGEADDATGYPALVRSADLIGQLADTGYLLKLSALFREFEETGTTAGLGFKNPDDLRTAYPKFFWQLVAPVIQNALDYLEVTQEGKQWTTNRGQATVFPCFHRGAWRAPPPQARSEQLVD